MPKKAERTFNFTDQKLKGLPVPQKPQQLDYFDAKQRGLGLRHSYGGAKTFFAMYSNAEGKRQRKNLGKYGRLEDGRLSLAAARKQAKAALGDVASGGDPAGEARTQRQAATVEKIAGDWIEAQKAKGRKAWRKQERILEGDILREIGHIKGRDLERRHVKAMLRKITDRPAPVLANRAHEVIRAMLNWALDQDEYGLEANAALRMDRNAEKKGERWLTPEEIKAYWEALDQEEAAPAAALRLCLLTAQRQQNVLGMRRDQISLPDRLWLVPASTTKTDRLYKVPLSNWAVQIIEERLAAIPDQEQYLFPKRGGEGQAGLTFLNKPHRRSRERAGLGDYPLHAHRRTFGRHADMMRISRLVWDGILGHVNSDMAELYSGHDFADQRLDAVERWANRIALALSENVVALARDKRAKNA